MPQSKILQIIPAGDWRAITRLQPLLEQARAEGKWLLHRSCRPRYSGCLQWLTPDGVDRGKPLDWSLFSPGSLLLASPEEVLAELRCAVAQVRRRLHDAEADLARAIRCAEEGVR